MRIEPSDRTPSGPTQALLAGALPGAWLALFLVCASNVLKNVDRVLLGVLAPGIKADFKLTDTEIGMLSMAFAVAYAVFGVPIGRAADRFSRRRIIAGVTTVWSLATAACGVALSYPALFLGRMGVAIGEAGLLPAAYSLVSDFFPARLRNLGLGLLNCSSSIGVAAGLALGGWLSHFGWRTAFIVLGLPGILVATAILVFLPEPKRGSLDEIKSAPKPARAGFLSAFVALMRNPLYLWIVVTAAFNTFSAVGMVQWLPSFFQRVHGMSLAAVGVGFGTAFGMGMLLGQLCGAALATYIGRHGVFRPLTIAIWSNLLLVPAYLTALWVPNPWMSMGMILVAAFLGALPHPAISAASQSSLPAELRGLGQATLGLMVALVGMGFGPLLIGMISDAVAALGVADPLRYALSAAQVVFVVAALAAWGAYWLGHSRSGAVRETTPR